MLIENPKLQRAVLSAVDMAQGSLDKVQANLEAWFNATMDRVSGWYKRRTQDILFWLGLSVAAALNIDAITITQRLTSDKDLRHAAVAQAEAIVSGAHANSGTPGDNSALTKLKNDSFSELTKDLQDIGFPVGWELKEGRPYPSAQACQWRLDKFDAIPNTVQADTQKSRECSVEGGVIPKLVLGWLVTALAVMLGAPFWFDILNKFMVVRSTVKPHEKSPEESSEDRQS